MLVINMLVCSDMHCLLDTLHPYLMQAAALSCSYRFRPHPTLPSSNP